MPVRKLSKESHDFNDLTEETNGHEINQPNNDPAQITILTSDCKPTDSPENSGHRPDEEVIETCALTRAYSRSLSRQSRPHVSGTSRPSLISHHMMNYADGDFDRVDALPEHMTFTILDALAILFSIGSFLFDIGTDIAVAAFHYINKDFWYEMVFNLIKIPINGTALPN